MGREEKMFFRSFSINTFFYFFYLFRRKYKTSLTLLPSYMLYFERSLCSLFIFSKNYDFTFSPFSYFPPFSFPSDLFTTLFIRIYFLFFWLNDFMIKLFCFEWFFLRECDWDRGVDKWLPDGLDRLADWKLGKDIFFRYDIKCIMESMWTVWICGD